MRTASKLSLLAASAAMALVFAAPQADARGVRAGAATSVHGASGRGASPARNSGGAQRNVDRGRDVNRSRTVDRDVNRHVDRDIDVHRDIDIDVDNGWDGHPIAAGVAFGTAAAVTAAAIGSVYYALPPACAPRPYSSITYYYCGNVWYEPRYSGTSITYVVVNQPY